MHNLVSSYSALSSQMISPYKCRYILYIYSPLYTTRFSHSVTYYIHIYIYIVYRQTSIRCIFLPVKPSSGCLKKKETRLRIPTSCSLSLSDLKKIPPGKLRWNPKKGGSGQMIFLFNWVIFRFHVDSVFGKSFNIHQLLGDFFEACWSSAIETNMFHLKLIAIKKDRLIIRECLWFQSIDMGDLPELSNHILVIYHPQIVPHHDHTF